LRADEPTTLRAFLDYHRDTLRWKCAGLSQQQLAQALPPTDMALGGLMKHLALVESDWFEDTFPGGSPMPLFGTVDWEADPDWEWHTAGDNSPEELFALFDEAVRRADAVVDEALAGPGLDAESQKTDGRGHAVQPAPNPRPRDRGVRPTQRPRRPVPPSIDGATGK
jgi:hypothetical protein